MEIRNSRAIRGTDSVTVIGKKGPFIHSYHPSLVRRDPTFQPSSTHATSPSSNDVHNSIHSDLLSCSRVMGVTETRLRENDVIIRQVGQTAEQFLEAVRLVIPKPSHFTGHKNPCFYSNVTVGENPAKVLFEYLQPEVGQGQKDLHKRFDAETLLKMFMRRRTLTCLPYFYVAGFPKSATTSLHEALQRHPQIVSPRRKEPHWWTRVDGLSDGKDIHRDHAKLNVWAYLAFFNEASEKIQLGGSDGYSDSVTYDGSQSLLWDSNFFQHGQDYCAMPAVLQRVQPKAKFVVVMRNPTTRLYSHFIWSFRYHLGDYENWPLKARENISESFHSEVMSVTNQFKDCLKSSSLFECASGFRSLIKMDSVGRIAHKFNIGLYYVHIRKWLQFYPREQFLFLRMEDMVANFTMAMARIVDFLGLRQVASVEMEKWLTKANALSGASLALMKNSTKHLLDEAYAPYNKLLAKLLDDDRYLWSDH